MLSFEKLLENKNDSDFEKLVELVVDLNLSIPVNLDNKINKKLNAIETQLKKMGINPRSRKFKKQ